MPSPDRNRRLTTFLAAIAVLIAAPLAVVAGDAFTDVPDDNVHHGDITWLADNGITAGCNPPNNTEFCPGDPVLRQQMASFMRRLAENEVVDAATANEADHATAADQADHATTADSASDADTVDGVDSAELQTRVDGVVRDTDGGVADTTIDLDQGNNIALGTVDVTTDHGSHALAIYGYAAENLEAEDGRISAWLQADNPDCDGFNWFGGSVIYQPLPPDEYGSLNGSLVVATEDHTTITFCARAVASDITIEDSSLSLLHGNVGSLDVEEAEITSNSLPSALESDSN